MPSESFKTIVVGLSGGPDSVFLVEFLEQKKIPNIIIAHFHHHLRGKEADDDAEFCKNLAGKKNYIFEQGDWEYPKPSENQARIARYTFLESIRLKYNADAIAIAHHHDDNVETILTQFFRGGSIAARSGLQEWNEKQKIWRPLLSYTKKEIILYLEKNNIAYCIDSSNLQSSIFTRNFVRHEIIPQIEKKFTGFGNRLIKEAQRMQEIEDTIFYASKKFLQKYEQPKGIDIQEFLTLPSFVQKKVLETTGNTLFSEGKTLQEIIKFLSEAKSGKKYATKHFCLSVYGERFFIENL